MSSGDLSWLLRPQPPAWYSCCILRSGDVGLQWNAWWLHYSWRDYNHIGYFRFVVSERARCGLHGLPHFVHWLEMLSSNYSISIYSVQMETIFVAVFDTSTAIPLHGIDMPVIDIRQFTTNQWRCRFAAKKRAALDGYRHEGVWNIIINDARPNAFCVFRVTVQIDIPPTTLSHPSPLPVLHRLRLCWAIVQRGAPQSCRLTAADLRYNHEGFASSYAAGTNIQPKLKSVTTILYIRFEPLPDV